MRVNSTKGAGPGGGSRKVGKGGSGSKFRPLEDSDQVTTQVVSGSSAIQDMDAILALQSVDTINPEQKKKNTVRHADTMLDELDKLKVALLSGKSPQLHLNALKRLLAYSPEYREDRELNDLLNQINLRVEVELAKFNFKR